MALCPGVTLLLSSGYENELSLRMAVVHQDQRLHQPRYRLGAVSYLNAKPLVSGLEHDPEIELIFDVPSRLPALLEEGRVDAALVPVIDLASPNRPWRIVSDACIGCDGETFTVRVFSRVPANQVRRLVVDGDSHTSVTLARIIWKESFGVDLELSPLVGREPPPESEALLLIGDKVVNHGLIGFDMQTDLGQAWKSLTGLPFVFAVWACDNNAPDTSDLAKCLENARDAGVRSAKLIAADYGPGMGWPVHLAERYLTSRLKFRLTPRHQTAMEKFFDYAKLLDPIGVHLPCF
ncbi:MAG: menaquinone biosynthesis protein [Planctomycetota bacterium]